jgi:hypothetical protein
MGFNSNFDPLHNSQVLHVLSSSNGMYSRTIQATLKKIDSEQIHVLPNNILKFQPNRRVSFENLPSHMLFEPQLKIQLSTSNSRHDFRHDFRFQIVQTINRTLNL